MKGHPRVDKLFAQWDKPGSPGCALAVIENGKTIYERGYGSANLECNIPITPESVFYVGSCSKQFTAMSIALLAHQGKLSLDDDIRKYVPEMPDYGSPITVRQLIHHTSGLRDYLSLLGIAGLDFGSYHKPDVLELIARQKELNFKPGDQYLYSNSGYFLLAVIVERVSGKSFREFTQENIFKPLGMTHTHFHDDYTMLIKNRASGYFPADQGAFRNFISTFDCVGSGGLFTSVEDLYFWDQNFYAMARRRPGCPSDDSHAGDLEQRRKTGLRFRPHTRQLQGSSDCGTRGRSGRIQGRDSPLSRSEVFCDLSFQPRQLQPVKAELPGGRYLFGG